MKINPIAYMRIVSDVFFRIKINDVGRFLLFFFFGLFCQIQFLFSSSSYPYWGEYKKTDMGDVVTPYWIPHQGVVKGWDWSLPPNTQPSPKGLMSIFRIFSPVGKQSDLIIDNLPPLKFECNPIVCMWINWAAVESKEGEYDFSEVRKSVERIAEKGYSTFVRIHTSATKFAPEWMRNYVPIRKERSKGEGVANYEVGHPEFHKRYLKLIEAFGKTKIQYMKEVKGLYFGYASPSNGDEGIGPHGQNPDTVNHVRERIDAWAAITKGIESKVYMGGNCNYGFSKGFGVRRGFVEMYLYKIPDPEIGQIVDENGYLCVDENNSLIKSNVFHGEVNEEYEEAWATEKRNFRFGKSLDSFPYRYFSSALRLLQMRCNVAEWYGFTLNPDLFAWVALELGRTVNDAPDTWCFLRESYLKNKNQTVKNFERWLYQRDVPGYETKPMMQIQHPIKMWMVEEGKWFDYIARLGKKIGFTMDENWPGKRGNLAIKVSYFDHHSGQLNLVYGNGKREVIKSHKLSGDGELKTVTFFVPDLIARKMKNNFDFTLEAGMRTPNIVVSFVRVIRLEK